MAPLMKRSIDSHHDDTECPVDERRVGALASRALAVLAANRRDGVRRLDNGFRAELFEAVISTDPGSGRAVIERMIESGITPNEICDVYIPETARALGDRWCEDTMPFAQVSIGSCRLQSLLRELTETGDPQDGLSATVAVMVVADEHHTLGAMVLTAQLRRLGASVRLILGQSDRDQQRIAAEVRFDAILLSTSRTDGLDDLAERIRALKASVVEPVPIVVGGALVTGLDTDDLCRTTGADHVTNDIVEALQKTGIAERLAAIC